MIKFYCYARCSTCQKAKRFLQDNNLEFTEYPITNHNISQEELMNLYKKSGLPIKKLFNTSGLVYRDLNLKDRLSQLSDEAAINLLVGNGMLIKRPILINDEKVLFGFKLNEYEELVSNAK